VSEQVPGRNPPHGVSIVLSCLFKYKAWANDELLSAMETLDPSTHADERHAAIRIFNHTWVVDRIFAAHLTGSTHGHEDTNTTDTPTLDALRAQVEASDRWYVDYAGSLAPAQLSEAITFRFTDGGSGRMTREEMLIHVTLHGGYHRGAIGRILAQLSIAPPRDIFTAYLHRAEPERRGQA
jgi:uncharacterized damage-inducible protein DinB